MLDKNLERNSQGFIFIIFYLGVPMHPDILELMGSSGVSDIQLDTSTSDQIQGLLEISQIEIYPLADIGIFEAQYQTHVASGEWKERSSDAYNDTLFYHQVFEYFGKKLGGASIVPHLDGYMISCLWSAEIGKGYGKKIIEKIASTYGNKTLYAYSKKSDFFEKVGFSPVEHEYSSTGAQLYKKIP